MAGLCAAFMLATIAFSSAVVAAEADHDCCGRDCPVCYEMQACISNFQLMGSSVASAEASLPDGSVSPVEPAPCVRRAPATTLQSLDVRFDE